jgi:hypothetical protein
MATVLIGQCLQREFVDPVAPQSLPSMLHVGHREATRLLGPELSAGPLAQLIDWAHGLSWGWMSGPGPPATR